jgi:hypothetical protein
VRPALTTTSLSFLAFFALGAWSGDILSGVAIGTSVGLIVGGAMWSSMTAKQLRPFGPGALTRMVARLSTQSVSAVHSEYRAREFGSWFIDVAATPPLRVVWDGKESCLSVQTQTPAIHPEFGAIYKDILTLYDPVDEAAALDAAADVIWRATAGRQ